MPHHEDPLFEAVGNEHRDVWHYCGDTNIEHGGLFYMLDDSVEAVSVLSDPATAAADHDDEAWYIQAGVISTNADDLDSALSTCGYESVDGGIVDCTGAVMTGISARRLVIESFHAHSGVETVQGPDRITRGEIREQGYEDLADYVRENYLRTLPVIGGPEGIEAEPSAPAPR